MHLLKYFARQSFRYSCVSKKQRKFDLDQLKDLFIEISLEYIGVSTSGYDAGFFTLCHYGSKNAVSATYYYYYYN